MHKVLFILFITGVILIAINITKDLTPTCQKQKIIYRYIPRSFEEEQAEPVYVSDIFRAMFTQPSTWVGEVNDLDTRNKSNINKYFISQM